jgi:hypothetical protein
VLIMSSLAAFGLHLLRRQTLEEFPPFASAPPAPQPVAPNGPAVPAG